MISKTLKTVKGKKEIDDKILNYLMVNDPRLGRFYLLPKIHKRLNSVPGRPVISNCGYLTENISSFLDFHLQPLAKKIKSFIKDSNDFLCKLRDLPPLPENALLCSIDVVGLYPSIPHGAGLQAMKKALEGREDKSVSTETLLSLAELVLKNNFFEHNNVVYKQNQGTAIGKKFAPSYAILFVGDFEERALENYHLKPWVWWRYIDDIFLVWEHGEEKLLEFIEYLNSISPHIKFTFKYSRESIEFLDVLVIKEGNSVHTDLFVKETDTHQFLHFSSCHPYHTKKGIPYSQAVRLRRICSTEEFFQKRVSNLKSWLLARGYDEHLVNAQVERASLLNRDTLLRNNSSKDKLEGREVFSTTFHPAINKRVYRILREAQVILDCDEEHKRVFSSIPLVSFRRAKTLQDILVRSKLPNVHKTGSCKGCGKSNCQVCDFLLNSSDFSNSEGNRNFSIRKGDFTCNSKFVIYRLICKTCNQQYVGSTKTAFRLRFNNYKSHFRSYCERRNAGTLNRGRVVPQAGLFSHFLQNNHHGMEDWQFQIFDSANSEVQLRDWESFWQHRLNTFLPIGLNDRSVPT